MKISHITINTSTVQLLIATLHSRALVTKHKETLDHFSFRHLSHLSFLSCVNVSRGNIEAGRELRHNAEKLLERVVVLSESAMLREV